MPRGSFVWMAFWFGLDGFGLVWLWFGWVWLGVVWMVLVWFSFGVVWCGLVDGGGGGLVWFGGWWSFVWMVFGLVWMGLVWCGLHRGLGWFGFARVGFLDVVRVGWVRGGL